MAVVTVNRLGYHYYGSLPRFETQEFRYQKKKQHVSQSLFSMDPTQLVNRKDWPLWPLIGWDVIIIILLQVLRPLNLHIRQKCRMSFKVCFLWILRSWLIVKIGRCGRKSRSPIGMVPIIIYLLQVGLRH